MLNRRHLLTAMITLLPLAAAAQQRIEGQTFDAVARVGGVDLVLNGVGVRAVAWLKGYAAGLYLAAKANTPAQVLATAGAKRLQLRLLQDVPAAEFVKAIDKGFARNTPAAEQPALQERREAFGRQVLAVGKVKKGDVVNLDFVPGRGLLFTLNGHPRGDTIPGEDLYAAVLRIFIGEQPVDARLKSGLLGGAAS
jgi:hypothetical protein